VGLQHAMLLVPSCYVMSGIAFAFAEKLVTEEAAAKKAAASQ